MTRPNRARNIAAAQVRSAKLLHKLDDGQRTERNPEMRHAPTCQRLVIVRTEGYSHTVWRCDECSAVVTQRHGAPPPEPNPQPTQETP